MSLDRGLWSAAACCRFRILLSALLFFVACKSEKPVPLVFESAPVVLISIDTLRADHLPAYGYTSIQTPNIDRLRADSILFRNVWSHSPMTLPSHVSMLTGLIPPDHGIRDNVGFRFDGGKYPSLPSLLRAAGYATGAAVSSYVLRSDSGLGAIFDSYDDAIDTFPGARFREFQRSGEITERVSERWLDANAARPFFYFFHIYEPHAPYEPSYDGEIVKSDAIVGRLLDHLRAKGLYDKSIIILTSDHGEGLNDHGEDQHSILIYREAMNVPLILKLPSSARAGTTVDAPAQLSDIFPTVLELLGKRVPPTKTAKSLLALPADREIYGESLYPRYHFGWSDLRSLATARWHLIDAPRPELYDVVRDPKERNDLAATQRRELTRLRNELAKYRDPVPPIGNVDPEEAAKLAALGYIGTPRNRGDGPLPNPNEMIGTLEPMREAIALAASGRANEAIPRFEKILAAAPEMNEVRISLAEALARTGRLEEAEDQYRRVIGSSELASSDTILALGEVQLQLGKFDDAKRAAESAIASNPRRARTLLARLALAQRDGATALEQAHAVADAHDAQPADLLLLAEVQQATGDLAGTLTTIDAAERRARALEIPKVFRLEFLRADTLARLGRGSEAIDAYRREIEAFPRHSRAYANLAVLYILAGDRRAADATLRVLDALDPQMAKRTRAALQ